MSDLEAAEREIDRLAAQRDALLKACNEVVADAIALAEGGAL